jgi:type VI secretion system protein ImpA
MSLIDVDALLQELDPAAPCGPNLEYDPVFLALELATVGKPEVQYGDSLTPAVAPDWKSVRTMATGLIERSRDLRLAVLLLRANLALSGIAGMLEPVRLIERLLDERWDSVHPQLDADDDMDPLLRINSLAILADLGTVVKDVKEATLLVLPGLGPLSVRTLDIATGELPVPDGGQKIALDSIEKAVADTDLALYDSAVDTLTRVLASVINIETLLVRQVGSSQALNLDALTRPLKRGRDFLLRQAPQRPDAEPTGADAEPGADGNSAAASGAGARAKASSDQILDRNDVLREIKRLLAYYKQHEPSSPIPLLLERAQRLVPMSFLEIMQDLAPDGLAQIKVIKGQDS